MIYLAQPYTLYHVGREASFIEAARITAALVKRGYDVFSPIVHGHPLSEYADIPPEDWRFWDKINAPFIRLCDRCFVVTLAGWRDSRGVTHEIDAFRKAGKPISFVDPVRLEVSELVEGAAA